jgi:uncharacterized protein
LNVTTAMIDARVPIDRGLLEEFCLRHGIRRLSLFGSALRSDFRPESDIDLLVEFVPGQRVSLFDLGGMSMEFAEILGRPVDLRTAEDLSRYFREEVLRTARPLYAA